MKGAASFSSKGLTNCKMARVLADEHLAIPVTLCATVMKEAKTAESSKRTAVSVYSSVILA